MTPAISVDSLRKAYGSLVAVDGLSFEVRTNEIFGMVGPNGAGKTTTVECLEGLRHPDGGRLSILGLDPKHRGQELRERVGIQLQQSALPDDIRVGEALDLFASFYKKSVDWKPLLETLGLAEKKNGAFSKLSGGQRQRLFIALALINDPELVFLDELTTGLDPHARRMMWDRVRSIRDQGKTVFLTTHYMEEAEALCDRVLVIDRGRIVALDSPDNLIRNLGEGTRIVFTADEDFDPGPLESTAGVLKVEKAGAKITVTGTGDRLVVLVINVLDAQGVRFRDLRQERPDLEEVFLALTRDGKDGPS